MAEEQRAAPEALFFSSCMVPSEGALSIIFSEIERIGIIIDAVTFDLELNFSVRFCTFSKIEIKFFNTFDPSTLMT